MARAKKNLKSKELTREDFSRWGKKGGATMKKRGKEFFSTIGKKGAINRWNNKLKNEE